MMLNLLDHLPFLTFYDFVLPSYQFVCLSLILGSKMLYGTSSMKWRQHLSQRSMESLIHKILWSSMMYAHSNSPSIWFNLSKNWKLVAVFICFLLLLLLLLCECVFRSLFTFSFSFNCETATETLLIRNIVRNHENNVKMVGITITVTIKILEKNLAKRYCLFNF